MPFDGRTIETHPDIVICDAAIEALRRHGWVQGRSGDKFGGFCIIGALGFAAQRKRLGEVGHFVSRNDDVINPLLRRRMARRAPFPSGEPPTIPFYNDHVAKRRKQAIGFLTALRNAIQKRLLHNAPAPSL